MFKSELAINIINIYMYVQIDVGLHINFTLLFFFYSLLAFGDDETLSVPDKCSSLHTKFYISIILASVWFAIHTSNT